MDDFFARLNLPRRYTLDPSAVERSYLEKSRALHPDYHSTASEAEQRASLELTAALNQAYLALNDPYRRIEHLLALAGGPTAGEQKNLDQAFLMEMMERRDRIEEAKASGSDTAAIESDLRRKLRELLDSAGAPFDSGELTPEVLIEVRKKLNAAKTIMSLLRDLAG